MADAKMFWQHCILHTCATIIGEFSDNIFNRGDSLCGVTFGGMSGFLKGGNNSAVLSLCLPWEPLNPLNLSCLSANWAQVSHTLSNWSGGTLACRSAVLSSCRCELPGDGGAGPQQGARQKVSGLHTCQHRRHMWRREGWGGHAWQHGTGGSLSHRLHLTHNRGAHITHCHLTAPVLSLNVITRLISHSLWLS